jgi:NADH-quinone oxidoreductase subunit H
MTVLASVNQPTLQDFGHDVWWIVLIKIVGIFALLVAMTLFAIVFERKVVARMQQRIGPNRVGPRGYLQSLADGLKLAFKEDIMPALADKPVYFLAPIIAAIPAFLAFSVIPIGPQVSMFGHHTPLQLTDAPIGVLVVLACSAMGVYGIVLAGWASGSTYPLLGGLRSAAQMVSYEIAMGLSIVAVFLYAGSMSTSEIVAAQADGNHLSFFGWNVTGPSWFAVLLPVSFVIYVVAVVGETNRAPFDLPEAESELVAGYSTEYSGMRYLFFFFAEWANVFVMSGIASALFLGGWQIPGVSAAQQEAHFGLQVLGAFIFLLKSWILIFVVVWIRWTLPRVRIDQMMNLCWKWFVPLSFVAFLLTAVWMVLPIPATFQLVISITTFVVWVGLMFHFVQRVRFNLREARIQQLHLNPFL